MGVLQIDDDLLRQQQEAYKVEGVDEDEQAGAQRLKKKRKQGSEEVSCTHRQTILSYRRVCIADRSFMGRATLKNQRSNGSTPLSSLHLSPSTPSSTKYETSFRGAASSPRRLIAAGPGSKCTRMTRENSRAKL